MYRIKAVNCTTACLAKSHQKKNGDGVMEHLQAKLIDVLAIAGVTVNEEQIQVIDRGFPHKPESLPKDKFGIYTFSFNGEFLKIGKAGASSSARFFSHHYNPNSSRSNLAKSLITANEFHAYNLSEDNVGTWMKQNLRRIDILIDASLGIFVLNLLEAFLHVAYQPKFEGFVNQRL